jgi:hypothetical protein
LAFRRSSGKFFLLQVAVMLDRQIVDTVLLVVAILGAVWVLTPVVMFATGQTRFRILVSEQPDAAEPTDDDADYVRRYQQFRELGFRPVGTTIETCWFINPIKWYRKSLRPLRWLATPDGRYLASFHRLIPTEPVRFGIVTLLSEEGMVRTTCPGVGRHRLEGHRLRIEVPNVEPAELFAQHQEHVASFCQAHGLAVRSATLRDAAAMEETNTRQLLPKLGAKLYKIPFSFFVLPTLIAGLAARRFGFSPQEWRTWAIAICVGTAAFAVFRLVTFPNLFRRAVERTRTSPRT